MIIRQYELWCGWLCGYGEALVTAEYFISEMSDLPNPYPTRDRTATLRMYGKGTAFLPPTQPNLAASGHCITPVWAYDLKKNSHLVSWLSVVRGDISSK